MPPGGQLRANGVRLRRLMRPARSRPVWSFVEVGHPWSGSDGRTIRPAEVRAAAWSGLIHGARGIVYFNHSFGGPNQTQHALRDPAYAAIRSAVSASEATAVAALAPVLGQRPDRCGATELGLQGAGTTAIVKWANGTSACLPATRGYGRDGKLLDAVVGSASATVLDEGRAIPVNGGSFADSFADGNAVHIYRIDGGSTCGLPTTAQPPPGARGPSVPRNLSRRTTARIGRLPEAVVTALRAARRPREVRRCVHRPQPTDDARRLATDQPRRQQAPVRRRAAEVASTPLKAGPAPHGWSAEAALRTAPHGHPRTSWHYSATHSAPHRQALRNQSYAGWRRRRTREQAQAPTPPARSGAVPGFRHVVARWPGRPTSTTGSRNRACLDDSGLVGLVGHLAPLRSAAGPLLVPPRRPSVRPDRGHGPSPPNRHHQRG